MGHSAIPAEEQTERIVEKTMIKKYIRPLFLVLFNNTFLLMQNYCYESDRLTALQELPVMDIPGAEERQNTHIVIKKKKC